jgi:hypothetical protein
MPTPVRASAETIPCVTVWPTPNGLPIASTTSPTSISSLSRKASAGSRSAPAATRSTARSVRGSRPRIVAVNSRRSDSTTVISSASPITWLLVTITPAGSTITPEPRLVCTRSRGAKGPSGSRPKNRRKNGSASIGGAVRTVRRVWMLTTAGAAARTTGAKVAASSARVAGTAGAWASSSTAGAGVSCAGTGPERGDGAQATTVSVAAIRKGRGVMPDKIVRRRRRVRRRPRGTARPGGQDAGPAARPGGRQRAAGACAPRRTTGRASAPAPTARWLRRTR